MNEQPPKRASIHAVMRKSGPYLSLGTSLAAPIVVLALLGRWLDVKWGTEPWLLLAGSLLGIVTGFYQFFKVVLREPGNGNGGDRGNGT